MQHSVPQFIEIEDKIIGPFSFRQALYLAGGIGLAWTIYVLLSKISFLPFIIKAVAAAPFLALGAGLAFVHINKRPLIFYIESFFKYQLNPKKFIWRRGDKEEVDERVRTDSENRPTELIGVDQDIIPTVTRSKIKNLALSLDMELDDKLSQMEIGSIKK